MTTFAMKRDNPEGRVVLSILKNLAWRGWYCGKIKVKGAIRPGGGFAFDPYTLRGAPDILSMKGDVILAIEAKAGKNTLTEQQVTFRDNFHAPPHRIYIEARSWEDVEKIIS
jgi:hypothetical protein